MSSQAGLRGQYQRAMLHIRGAFDAGATGITTITARSRAIDELIGRLWAESIAVHPKLAHGVTLLAVGGYGREQLFPYSDIDLLFLLDSKVAESTVKAAIRSISQELWDLGLRVAPTTRKAAECERFDPEVAEFTFSLLDHRFLAGDGGLYDRTTAVALPRLLQREHKAVLRRLIAITDARHAKYGDTLFHLEPNIKDCPGGLRDVHVCGWIAKLSAAQGEAAVPLQMTGEDEFRQAVEFLFRLRCFLHYRHERDDNILDWTAQDAAAASSVGLAPMRPDLRQADGYGPVDAAYWMRLYFRHARSVERRVAQCVEAVADHPSPARRFWPAKLRRTLAEPPPEGYRLENGRIALSAAAEPAASGGLYDPAFDPDVVLHIFSTMAETGGKLSQQTEDRLAQALPVLSAYLEEGAVLWHPLRRILKGRYAGAALRSMHALGILELLIPEFHGIDALVVRDAYHRYTVDEHTFVAIDTLHGLEAEPEAPGKAPMLEWTAKFHAILRDMPHAELLYLATLLHDTGKGRSTGAHAAQSVRMARSLLARLELDEYESGLVTGLIENHLEMSAALRRDIFDSETVRVFAGKAATPEALRLLTLFTYADINAVHPDALTPWKAENIWRLYIATSNYLDRSVDEERVTAFADTELVHRVTALLAGKRGEIAAFLDGFPERYLRTRTPEQVRSHFVMTTHFLDQRIQLDFRYAPELSEITLVTEDRPQLFATLAGVLAAWGMNIVSADAFSNRQGVIVDTFRFTDSFRTLEMNASEHEVLVQSARDVLEGKVSLEKLLAGRRRPRRKAPMVAVEQRIEFDNQASSQSTLLQVVAQDVPGLLRAISHTLAAAGCNIEVALVDTEGETAIDVFYITLGGGKLGIEDETSLRSSLARAIDDTLH